MADSGENSGREAEEEHDGTNGRRVDEPVPRTAGDPVGPPVPRGPRTGDRRRRLVLHVDLNNTVLVSDSVTGQGPAAALEYFLSTVTWGKMSAQGEWEWLSDSASLLPPCDGAVSYYSQFGRTPGFIGAAGRRFRGILDEHLDLFRWPEGAKADSALCVEGAGGRLFHWILPSFFQLLVDLVQEGRSFSVVFRTFGSDLPRALGAVSRALGGAHPLFPDLPALKLQVDLTPGEIRCSEGGTVLSRADRRLSTREGDRDRDLYRYLSSVRGLGGFQDHFAWWASNSFSARGGKPLWVDPFDQQVQHIFIDDNIRHNDDDTIVLPKVFLAPGGTETRVASTSELYDVVLVQTDLLQAIAQPSYFTRRVHVCLDNYERSLQQGAL